jgi:tRNA pseudouridine38/39 synthase
MPLAARTERALLDAFGLEPSAEGRRALAASLRAAADVVDGDAASPSSEPAPPPRVDDGADAGPPAPASRAARGFDVREYPSAYVALRVMYAGWDYRGFAQQGSDGVRTVEGALFSALRRTRLIAPDAAPEDVAYTRCGRTDAGVSALGQIVSLRLRSKRGTKGRKRREETNEEGPRDPLFSSDDSSDDAKRRSSPESDARNEELRNDGALRGASSGDRRAARSDSTHPPPGGVFFAEHAEDELDYCALLNRALPEDVRVTGWGYVHESFSARFDCEFRLYKYFFCAFPDSAERSAGPLVSKQDEGDEKTKKLSGLESLDLDAMRDAARRFEGTHDFRNLCKMDARNVHNYVRTVYRCDVVDAADAGAWEDGGGARGTRGALGFSRLKKSETETSAGSPPGLCYVRVEGSAFLWHQVRCMAAVLFLVGLRRETPDVVDALLDATKFKNGKPQYEMAPDAPLVLWRCGFARDALRLTASAAARAQMQVHAARHTAASLKRAAVWAELWASLRAEAEAGEGDGNASAAREADDASGSLVAGEVVAAACALSAPGRAAGGGAAAKAAYVPLERRATEMTYEERRARIEEKEAER